MSRNYIQIHKLLQMVEIEELPEDLIDDIKAQSRGTNPYASELQVLTYIRHELSNYDALRRTFTITTDECDQLRERVNLLAKVKFEQWRKAKLKSSSTSATLTHGG